jgi:hypothetical protein
VPQAQQGYKAKIKLQIASNVVTTKGLRKVQIFASQSLSNVVTTRLNVCKAYPTGKERKAERPLVHQKLALPVRSYLGWLLTGKACRQGQYSYTSGYKLTHAV